MAQWYDAEGLETGDSSITGIPVLVAGGQQIYVDGKFDRYLSQFGRDLLTNGAFSEQVPQNGTGGGWTSSSDAWWRGDGVMVLNTGAGPRPTVSQTLTGLIVGVEYTITASVGWFEPEYASGQPTYGSHAPGTFVMSVDGVARWTPTILGNQRRTIVTQTFRATATSHSITLQGQVGDDSAYVVDSVSVREKRVAAFVTDWSGVDLYIDQAGRRTDQVTLRASTVPVERTVLVPFTRVYDAIVAGGGNDVLNISSSSTDLRARRRHEHLPRAGLAPGLQRPPGAPLERGLEPRELPGRRRPRCSTRAARSSSTRSRASSSSTPAARSSATSSRARSSSTPTGCRCCTPTDDPMLHLAGEPIVHMRGDAQRALGGEPVRDEQGNAVYNGASPFLKQAGQVLISDRKQVVYELIDATGNRVAVDATNYTPRTLAAPAVGVATAIGHNLGPAGGEAPDRLIVTAYQGTRIWNLVEGTDYTIDRDGLEGADTITLLRTFTGPVTLALTIAVPALHAVGAIRYNDGSERVQLGDLILDATGAPTFDQAGTARRYTTMAELLVSRREMLTYLGSSIPIKLINTAADITNLRVTVGGVRLTTGFTLVDNVLTITASATQGARVIVEYTGRRLHKRGTAVYKPGTVVVATYTTTDDRLKRTLGSEALRWFGGEQAEYDADDVITDIQSQHRLDVRGTGIAATIHWLGMSAVNLVLGSGNDTVDVLETHTGTTSITTAGGADTVAIRTVAGLLSVSTGDANDTVTVGGYDARWPQAHLAQNQTVDLIGAALTLDAGDGFDTLLVDDTRDTSANVGSSTLNRIDGLDMVGGISYLAFEGLTMQLGSGGDTFTIHSTHTGDDHTTLLQTFAGGDSVNVQTISGPTTVETGLGTDTILVGHNGSVDGIDARLTILGGSETGTVLDRLLVDDSSDTTSAIATLSPGTLAGLGMTLTSPTGRADLLQVVTLRGATDGRFTLRIAGIGETEGIDYDASATTVLAALEALPGLAGNVAVVKVGETWLVTLLGAYAGAAGWALPELTAQTVSLTGPYTLGVERMSDGRIDYTDFEILSVSLGLARDVVSVTATHAGTTSIQSGGGDDRLAVETTDGALQLLGEAGNDVFVVNPTRIPGEPNGIGDLLRIDGGAGSDRTTINLFGNGVSDVEVTDTAFDGGTNLLTVNGTSDADTFLLRARLVAMLNTPTSAPNGFVNAERVRYDGGINAGLAVNGLAGDDRFALDDTSSLVTVNGDDGNDSFQVGQLVGDLPQFFDPVATVDTTYGKLTNGVSFAATINGGRGDDRFGIFRNKAALSLNGDAGDDEFLVRTFLAVDQYTAVNTGEGDDTVRYVLNAPIAIDGGAGSDKVIVLGTEAGDTFVITSDGIFGAGRFITFVGVENVDVDGMEGDDRFFVLSTKAGVRTRIFGGLGSDTVNVGADAPAVVANDLLGHSGLIEHTVTGPDAWMNLAIQGLGVDVADEDEPGVVITQSGGSTIVGEGGRTDTVSVVLTRAPTVDVLITIAPSRPSTAAEELGAAPVLLSAPGSGDPAESVTLTFTAANWNVAQVVTVRAGQDLAAEGTQTVALLASLVSQRSGTFSGISTSGNGVRIENLGVLGTNPVGSEVVLTNGAQSQTATIQSLEVYEYRLFQFGSWSWYFPVYDPRFVLDEPVDAALAAGGTWTILGASDFQGLALPITMATVLDDDAAGVVVLPTDSTPWTLEGGRSTTYEVILNRPALAELRIALQAVGGQLGLSATELVFAAGETSKTVTATAVHDGKVEGFHIAHVDHRLLTSDAVQGTITTTLSRVDELEQLGANFATAGMGLRGYTVRITSGAGAGQIRQVRSNSADRLVLGVDWDIKPVAGDTYVIEGYTGPATQLPISGTVTSATGGLTLTLGAPLPTLSGPGGLVGATLRVFTSTGVVKRIVTRRGRQHDQHRRRAGDRPRGPQATPSSTCPASRSSASPPSSATATHPASSSCPPTAPRGSPRAARATPTWSC